jgi:hypothetical protein
MVDGLGIYKDFEPTNKPHINTGYVYIEDTSIDGRIACIEKCLRNEYCDLLVEGGGGIARNVKLPKHILRDIQFPPVNGKIGSFVSFFTEPYSSNSFAVGVHNKNDETDLSKENTYKVIKSKDGCYSILTIMPDGTIGIDAIGTAGKGSLTINVRNSDYTAQVNINVKGNININCEGDTNITNTDGDINVNTNQNVNINPDKLIVGGGSEPMLLGTVTETELTKEKQALTDLITLIQNTCDAAVPVVPYNKDATWAIFKTNLQQIIDRADYTTIKSDQSFLK